MKLKAYKSYAMSVILHGNEAWCIKKSKMRFLRRTERPMVITMCGKQPKDRKDIWN